MFTISVDDLQLYNGRNIEERECNRICSQIIRETGAEIEMFTSKNMNLTFIIKGKKANVIEAKRRFIEKFQIQVISLIICFKDQFIHFFYLYICYYCLIIVK